MDINSADYQVHIVFFKIDSDFKVLRNQKYELVPYDTEKSTGIFLEEGEYGQQVLTNESISMDILPQYVKETINSIQTPDDYRVFKNSLGNNFQLSERTYNNTTTIEGVFYVPVKLKQIKVSPGYKKKDLGVIFNINYYIKYNSTNTVLSRRIYGSAIHQTYVDINQYNNINTVAEMQSLSYDSIDGGKACINTIDNRIIIDDYSQCTAFDILYSQNFTLVPYFQDEEGTITLEISNTVNDLTKYNASNNKKLEYKIYVKNTGNAPSSNNVLKTNVPDKVIVDEASISDAGVYNKQKNIITWNIERIDDEQQIVVSYKALAPDTVSGEELIGNSTVLSDQQTTESYSNNTIVTLDKIVEIIKNPNTGTSMIYIPNTNIGMPISILLAIVMLIGITILVVMKKTIKKLR